jgi:hypothetical protein
MKNRCLPFFLRRLAYALRMAAIGWQTFGAIHGYARLCQRKPRPISRCDIILRQAIADGRDDAERQQQAGERILRDM